MYNSQNMILHFLKHSKILQKLPLFYECGLQHYYTVDMLHTRPYIYDVPKGEGD